MISAGVLGLVVTLIVVDPLRSRTWAAGLVLGLVLLGAGLLLGVGAALVPVVFV